MIDLVYSAMAFTVGALEGNQKAKRHVQVHALASRLNPPVTDNYGCNGDDCRRFTKGSRLGAVLIPSRAPHRE